jgi:hypothetical protein
MIPDFETNKSEWTIRVTIGELIDVMSALTMIGRSGGTGEAHVWLTKVPNGPRLWIIRERIITTWITADAESTDPTFALPIPDRFIPHLIEVASGSGGADLFYNEMEGAIIGRGADRYVSTDHPDDAEFTEKDMPYLGRIHGFHASPAVAEVSVKDLTLFSDTVHDFPRDTSDGSRVFPFVHVAIGDGQFAWTMDWRRYNAGRTTGSIPARTNGHSTFTFYPYILARYLRSRDDHEEARIFVDEDNSDYVFITGDKWGVRCLLDREELARWSGDLKAQLEREGFEVEETEGERIPDYYTFMFDNVECFASVHCKDDELTEYIRLTHILTTNTPANRDVFEEINNINATLYGARLVLRDGEIRIIVEFPAKAVTDMGSHLSVLKTALDRCKNLTVFLPLFSDSH